jgi:hypothetical protein
MKAQIIDKETGEIVGSVITNRSMTGEEIGELSGIEYDENIHDIEYVND